MSSSGVKVLRDLTKDVFKSLAVIADQQVLIGIPEGKDDRKEAGEPIGNAGLGYITDKGSPLLNIPASPFLEKGVSAVADQCADELAVGAKGILDGGATMTVALNRAGLIAQSSVKATLVAGEGFAPLKPATLKARQRAGFAGTKRAIRTGQLLNSISYIIRKK